MPVDRLLPNEEARELIELTRDIADKVLDPIVDEHEKARPIPKACSPRSGRRGC